jgi:hypothetical protein
MSEILIAGVLDGYAPIFPLLYFQKTIATPEIEHAAPNVPMNVWSVTPAFGTSFRCRWLSMQLLAAPTTPDSLFVADWFPTKNFLFVSHPSDWCFSATD